MRPLKTHNHAPVLDHTYDPNSAMGGMLSAYQSMVASLTPEITVTEAQHRRNLEKIELAGLDQDRESINNNLAAQQ